MKHLEMLNEDEMEYMKRGYKVYLKDSIEDPNFEITSIENFEEWVEEEIYWQNMHKCS
ncbi:MAG: hypothetical protein QME12_06680 [Nanoarchaeota archaeon]|nr:hypothetical protein [Nanoarchaeota archaeon]